MVQPVERSGSLILPLVQRVAITEHSLEPMLFPLRHPRPLITLNRANSFLLNFEPPRSPRGGFFSGNKGKRGQAVVDFDYAWVL